MDLVLNQNIAVGIKNLLLRFDMENEKIAELVLAHTGKELSPELIQELKRLVVSECTQLIDMHAKQLRKFNFVSNAQTAETCAGILKEHFKVKEPA